MKEAKYNSLRIGVIGSTRGTDMQAIIDDITNGSLSNVEISMVVSNRSKSGILERARIHNIPHKFVSIKAPDGSTLSREEYDERVTCVLKEANVELLLMIGYMRIVSPKFSDDWYGRCLNVHPSLLPAFAGGMDMDVHEKVLKSGVEKTGCTIHLITAEVDSGPIVLQMECWVDNEDTPESLKEKVQNLEGLAFCRVIEMYQKGELTNTDANKCVIVKADPSRRPKRS
jgi:phosphoribosylglycinamide formyltransferase-1